MEKRPRSRSRFYRCAHLLALLGLFVYLMLCTDAFDRSAIRSVRDFSDGWFTGDGAQIDTDTLVVGDFGGVVTIHKQLPDTLSYQDALCFLSNNTRVEVRIEDNTAYSFNPKANLTGWGYGMACHTVNFSPSDAGKTVYMRVSTLFSNRQGGRILNIYLGSPVNYMRFITFERAFAGFASAIILFLGILMMVIYFCLPKKSALPYDLFSLGLALFALGLWSVIDTTLPNLLTGNLYVFRVLDYLLTHLAIFPLTCFVNSVTQLRRHIYPRIAFWFSLSCIALLIALRYGLELDMHILNVVIYADYLCFFVLTIAMLTENRAYCRKQNQKTDLRGFSIGAGALIAAVISMTFTMFGQEYSKDIYDDDLEGPYYHGDAAFNDDSGLSDSSTCLAYE